MLCYFESLSLKFKIAKDTKRKFLLFKIAFDIDDLFKVAQHYHFTQNFTSGYQKIWWCFWFFFYFFFTDKGQHHTLSTWSFIALYCRKLANMLGMCNLSLLKVFVFHPLQKGLFLVFYWGNIKGVTITTEWYNTFCYIDRTVCKRVSAFSM